MISKIHKYFYIFIGFIFTSIIIWDRLIRVRLPRDIPYNLTELSFLLLCATCVVLFSVFIIITLRIELKGNRITMFPVKATVMFINYLFNQYDTNINRSLIEWLYNNKIVLKYCFILFKVLRFMMILLFTYEVFFLHKIKVFYIFFPILLLPLLFSYFIFFLSNMYDEQLTFIDERLEIHHSFKSPSECIDYMDYTENYYKIMKAQEWIQQMAWVTLNLVSKSYKTTFYLNKSFKLNTPIEIQKDSVLKREYYNNEMQKAKYIVANNIELYCIIYYFNETKNSIYTLLNIIILLLYLITWLFILIKSFHTLQDMPITLHILKELTKNLSNNNPFIDS